ncbi:hypothetical protein NA56DRAFT_707096 [Hyaloscypha hepaticicola]|uniref:Uncharacterized protein n=1 Tax=Hyaloscypha hepaticicola TaxID=2082293 RepID=A0A2J6PVL6_9HELO|nr:hypothetical protein NA56DRAFT_707096 [Hyaloscypha hepaticicola]
MVYIYWLLAGQPPQQGEPHIKSQCQASFMSQLSTEDVVTGTRALFLACQQNAYLVQTSGLSLSTGIAPREHSQPAGNFSWQPLLRWYAQHMPSVMKIASGVSVPDSGLQIQLSEVGSGHFEWILDPPPELMLFACLVLGCSISSFAYRRQDGDKYQTPIFILAIASATIFGIAMGVTANVIMLGVIPWALCLAMIGSVATHWLIRRCSRDRNIIYTEIHRSEQSEKEAPVPETQPC